MNPTIAFRVDASLSIGSGHVMRCLTLAAQWRAKGARCVFICRLHPGNLIDKIRQAGFEVESLALDAGQEGAHAALAHSHWLGASQQQDSAACNVILANLCAQWLVVDHYALDHTWERQVAGNVGAILVIDDLADRSHACDILLDQNLGRVVDDYQGLVPARCKILVGPGNALLREEFARLRAQSLIQRDDYRLRSIAIAMGGVDLPDATGQVLAVLQRSSLPAQTCVKVIMGGSAPALASVQRMAADMRLPTEVLVDIDNVGEVLAGTDLVIGAVGGGAWERCALAVPSILVILAENQRPGAEALVREGAALSLGTPQNIAEQLPGLLARAGRPEVLRGLSEAAGRVTDGGGALRLVQAMQAIAEASGEQGRMRPMTDADLHLVWSWRNHPDVRRYMYTTEEIAWDEHCAWFARTRNDPARHLLIFEFQGAAYGFVSFTERGKGGIADWGFYLAATAPRGMGRKLGAAALAHGFVQLGLHKICGQVIEFNERSARFHRTLGFAQEGVLRDQHFDGTRYHNVVHFGLLRDEPQRSTGE